MIFKRIFIVLIMVLLMFAMLLACTSGTTTSEDTSTTDVSGVSFSRDIQPIFNTNCVVCHQSVAANGDLNLEVGSAYDNLVNVESTQSLLRLVTPGDSDGSYLLNKLRGTQWEVGGSGLRMPYGAPPLQQSQINLIQRWIEQGALDN